MEHRETQKKGVNKMYHIQEYPERMLSPVWKRIVELIEVREYNQARKELEFLYRETNKIMSIIEEIFPSKDSKRQTKKLPLKKPKNKEAQGLTTKEGSKNNEIRRSRQGTSIRSNNENESTVGEDKNITGEQKLRFSKDANDSIGYRNDENNRRNGEKRTERRYQKAKENVKE